MHTYCSSSIFKTLSNPSKFNSTFDIKKSKIPPLTYFIPGNDFYEKSPPFHTTYPTLQLPIFQPPYSRKYPTIENPANNIEIPLTRNFFFLSGVMKPFLAFLALEASSIRFLTSALLRSISACLALLA